MNLVRKQVNLGPQLNWRKVRDLPGAQLQILKQVGIEIFREMGFKGIDDLQYLAFPMGRGLPDEIKSFLFQIKEKGSLEREDILEFHKVFPGYSPNTQLWVLGDQKFLIVSDPFGLYVYSEFSY